ncbi:hypothetical protein BZG36_00579 [Bifiguratus adelaidae]|uniref:NADP-dependent oxidoreductase domain-containing protein n=1 Tax=Bifiguratus adelaidae TaxID=1938954 RepID=A0A261Y7C3_9FUNG|nr:hypothetical protein BZG36_00579 [Bifiguratus adelaidae]
MALNTVKIPSIGFGTGTAWYKGDPDTIDDKLVKTLLSAFKHGYRFIDGAESYGTEREIGAAIAQSGLSRSDLFISTKILKSIGNPEEALRKSLERLNLTYVDLYIIHAPYFTQASHGIELEEAWPRLEALVDKGLVRALGVSNFRIEHLERLLKVAKYPPAVNQIEFNPYCQDVQTVEFCRKHGIIVEAYAPLSPIVYYKGTDRPVDSVLDKLAQKYATSQASILLAWVLSQGHVAILTTSKTERQEEYIKASEIKLTEAEISDISRAGQQVPEFRKFWASAGHKQSKPKA